MTIRNGDHCKTGTPQIIDKPLFVS